MTKEEGAQFLAASSRIVRAVHNEPQTVLVAGGAGFVGSHLCDTLIADGCRVICLDNLQTGRRSNIAHLLEHERFTFVRHDVIQSLDWVKYSAPFADVSRVYNLACAASPEKYQRDPIHTFKTSVLGAMNLLDFARDNGARILQASTSEVYGDPEISPQPESYRGCVNTVGPRSCYDEGKRAAETLFHDYCTCQGVDARIARIFNTYGPRTSATDGRVVSNFVVQALSGQDITIFGTGQQTRSFCYVDDLVDGLRRLMESDQPGHHPVNLGNPGEFTILELAEIVVEKTRSRSRLVFRDLPVDDPRQRKPDISRAQSTIGWNPRVPLRQGLDPTIAWFAAEMQRNVPHGMTWAAGGA